MSATYAVWIVAFYGAFSLIGGIIGYVKAKSTASLIAGGVSGAVLLWCAYGMQQGSRNAAIAALIIAVGMGGRFSATYRNKRRIFPDLVMLVLSALTLAATALALK